MNKEDKVAVSLRANCKFEVFSFWWMQNQTLLEGEKSLRSLHVLCWRSSKVQGEIFIDFGTYTEIFLTKTTCQQIPTPQLVMNSACALQTQVYLIQRVIRQDMSPFSFSTKI